MYVYIYSDLLTLYKIHTLTFCRLIINKCSDPSDKPSSVFSNELKALLKP